MREGPRSPRVTVLIDNFNYARFLGAAIDSALAQDYPDVEVVVVDDGSCDASAEVIAAYGDRVVSVLKPNGGQGSAFNAGHAVATGNVVCLLDADDLWHPEKVGVVVEMASRHPRGVLFQHRIQPMGIGVHGRRPVPYRLLAGRLDRVAVRSGGWWPFAPASALSFRRDFLDQVLPIPEEQFRLCADAYLADAAPFFGEVVSVPDVLGVYRMHPENGWAGLGNDGEVTTMRTYNQRWELRSSELNRLLTRTGSTERVRLERHFYYQRHRLLLGEREGRNQLSRLALTWPAERSPIRRLRNAAGLWRRNPAARR